MADGFYGSITKYEKSAFKFDKIYPNRKAMAAGAATDGVFIGRYVLIDYDLIQTEGQEKPVDGSTSGNGEEINENTFTLSNEKNSLNSMRLLGANDNSQVSSPKLTEQYANNRSTDWDTYGNRDWDSTVWQKIYAIQNEKKVFAYRFIADLNTIKPVIDVLNAPASAETLIVPQLSSNEFYTIQMPDNWNFMGGEITIPGKQLEGIEDGNVFNGEYSYNQNDNIDNLELTEVLNNEPYHEYFIKNEDTQEIEEYVKPVSPNPDITKDTKQMLMNLPSITTAVSNMWDSVYGKPFGENTYVKRNTDTEWDSYNGIRALEENNGEILFNKNNLKTLAGTINSVHDLMGMIIDTSKTDLLKVAEWDASKIYYIGNKFYAKHKKYNKYDSFTNQPSVLMTKQDISEFFTGAIETENEEDPLLFRLQIYDIIKENSGYTFKIRLQGSPVQKKAKRLLKSQLVITKGTNSTTYSQKSMAILFPDLNSNENNWTTISFTDLENTNFSLTEGENIYINYEPISYQNFEINYENIGKNLNANKANITNELENKTLYVKITPDSAAVQKYTELNDWKDYIQGQKIYTKEENMVEWELYTDGKYDFIPYKFYEDYNCTIPIIDYTRINDLEKVYVPSEGLPLYTWEAKELINFGRDISTLHGLLLRLFNLLPDGNTNNQDLTTIQGCLNLLNQSRNKIQEFYDILIDFQEEVVKPDLEELDNQFNIRNGFKPGDVFDLNNGKIIENENSEGWTWVEKINGLIDLVKTEMADEITALNTAINNFDNKNQKLLLNVDEEGILNLSLTNAGSSSETLTPSSSTIPEEGGNDPTPEGGETS